MEEKEYSNFSVLKLFIENVGHDCDLYLANKLNLPLIYLVATFAERSIFSDKIKRQSLI